MEKPKNKKFKFSNKFHSNYQTIKEHVQVIKLVKRAADKSSSIPDDWSLYLPDQSYSEFAHFNGKLKAIEKYFAGIDDASLNSFSENGYFLVNVNNISKDKDFSFKWPNFIDDLIDTPKIVIGLFGFSMHQLIKERCTSKDDDVTDPFDELGVVPKTLNPRFVGLQSFLNFQDLQFHNYGKFKALIGTVVRVSEVKPFCLLMAFKCTKCQTVQVVVQKKGCYTVPNSCTDHGCFGKVFKPLLDSRLTQTVPFKTIRLQEINQDNDDDGHVLQTVECELTQDLTDSCMPGDTVVISGIVTESNNNERREIGKDKVSCVLHISANSVVCLKGMKVDPIELTSGYLGVNSDEHGAFDRILSQKNIFRLIVSSLAPNIYGHELIKAGLVLGLFGGQDTATQNAIGSEFSVRKNSHILIVGDPGLGKSQMLLACTKVSPRGVYVCGNSTTSSGLTVTLSKGSGGENSIEAGALVLGDQGHCCIDEFDKMMDQHSALLEAMEQQTISIAKSGIMCTFPARTSILAAANPSGGHYDRSKTVSENLRIGGSVLSRFDLVFIVEDDPVQDSDKNMSRHVMGLHTLHKSETGEGTKSSYFHPRNNLQGGNQLLRKLKLGPNETLNLIPHRQLQKYISHARKCFQPKIPPEVAKILQEFYLDMRKQGKLSYSTPITTRQLETLIRLTEARARIELRASCTITDAEDVIEIMKYSMRETYSDEFGNIDYDRSIHGSGMSKSTQAKKLVNIMTKIATTRADDSFTTAEIKGLCSTLKIPMDSSYALIDTLNVQGFILKKGHHLYQLQTL